MGVRLGCKEEGKTSTLRGYIIYNNINYWRVDQEKKEG